MDRRAWTFVLLGAYLAAAVGFAYAMTYDVQHMCPGIPGPCGPGQHDEIFGWQPGWLAVPIWTAIGAISGVIVGLVADRVLRRSESTERGR